MAPPATPRRILYADADAMFTRCAMLADPDGAGRAELLVVGGRAESRGVVTSASYAARAYGIRAGMPISQAVRLCPRAMFVPVPGAMVSRKSREMHEVLCRWSPVVSARSVDEFALDMSGTEGLYHGEPLAETAWRIREDVLRETGMPMSFGGATNVLVAKLAIDLAKPSAGGGTPGVHVVPPGEEAAFVATLDLAAIPGIGPKFQAKLRARGLVTVRDALKVDAGTLRFWFGEGTGEWLWEVVRGIHESPVQGGDVQKSTSREETFAEDVDDETVLERELLRLAARVSADLRADGHEARTVTVKLRDADFTTRQASRTLDAAIASDRAVYLVARPLLAKLRRDRRMPSRLLGIQLSGLDGGAAATQLALFADPAAPPPVETPRDRTVAELVDRINAKHGRDTIGRGPVVTD